MLPVAGPVASAAGLPSTASSALHPEPRPEPEPFLACQGRLACSASAGFLLSCCSPTQHPPKIKKRALPVPALAQSNPCPPGPRQPDSRRLDWRNVEKAGETSTSPSYNHLLSCCPLRHPPASSSIPLAPGSSPGLSLWSPVIAIC